MNLKDKIKEDIRVKELEDARAEEESQARFQERINNTRKNVESLLFDIFREKVTVIPAKHMADWCIYFFVPALNVYVTTKRDDLNGKVVDIVECTSYGLPYSRPLRRPADFKDVL